MAAPTGYWDDIGTGVGSAVICSGQLLQTRPGVGENQVQATERTKALIAGTAPRTAWVRVVSRVREARPRGAAPELWNPWRSRCAVGEPGWVRSSW